MGRAVEGTRHGKLSLCEGGGGEGLGGETGGARDGGVSPLGEGKSVLLNLRNM